MPTEDLIVKAGWTSRKYRAAWKLTLLMTGLFVLPSIISLVLTLCGFEVQLRLLPVEYYIPFVTGIWLAYFGANVAEKIKGISVKLDTVKVLQTAENKEGFGGQPVDGKNP